MKRILCFLMMIVLWIFIVPSVYAMNTVDLGTIISQTVSNDGVRTIDAPYLMDHSGHSINFCSADAVDNNMDGLNNEHIYLDATMRDDILRGNLSDYLYCSVDASDEVVVSKENYIGTVSAYNTIILHSAPVAGTYTLRYANETGALESYAEICSIKVVDPAIPVYYDGLIAENCAPVEATIISAYNETNEYVGDIALGDLANNPGLKLYSFGVLADIHVNEDDEGQAFFLQ